MNDTMNAKSKELPLLRIMTESGPEEVHYPLTYDGFPEEFKFMAEEELKETEERKISGLQMLKDDIMYDTMSTNSHELPVLRFMTESGSEDVHYPVMYEGFPEEFKILAEEELKESEEKKLNGLQVLKNHIKRKKLHKIPDYLLLATLRASKYDLKKSKNKLEKLISMRKEIVDLVVKTGLKKVEIIMDNFSCGLLPYRDKHGSAIGYTRPDGFDLDLHSVEDVGSACLLIALFTIQFPITTVSGGSYFADCKHSSIAVVYPTVKALKRFAWHPFSLPIRASKVNVLNPFSVAYWFYKITRPLIPEKIRKRICFLPKGYEALQKEYNKNILPEEFGGIAGPLSNSQYKVNVLEFARKLIAEYG